MERNNCFHAEDLHPPSSGFAAGIPGKRLMNNRLNNQVLIQRWKGVVYAELQAHDQYTSCTGE